ncbi:DUF169 domain-containing protein [Chloroflexota bacterium]
MNLDIKDKFQLLWERYFNHAELPITFYYTKEEGHAELVGPNMMTRCAIGALSHVRKGRPLCFNVDSVGCPGGKRYLGFTKGLIPDFEYFLSFGIPGKMEGERYKKTPEIVKESMKYWPEFEAPAPFIVFKRWDMLEETDSPEVVIFFAEPDVLSGLFTLFNFDEAGQDQVIAPFGAGCNTIVQYPYLETGSDHPRAVIGMFDISARPLVPGNTLTFTVPIGKLTTMTENIEESFLITKSWRAVQKRIK